MGTESTTEAAPGPGRGGSLHATAARERSLERLTSQDHDALIVGGGINGAISALALASHGLRVALIDSEDFGSGVSQESSNLIWGGFKYLQSYDVALVAGLCRSRNLLARAYASRIREVRFLAALGPTSPYSPAYAALGAHAYWALGRFATDRPRLLSPDSVATAEPAIDSDDVQGAVEYSDYLLADNDARFVLQLLLDAVDKGAVAVSRVRLDGAERARRVWRASVTDRLTGNRCSLSAAILVNAGRPSSDGTRQACRHHAEPGPVLLEGSPHRGAPGDRVRARAGVLRRRPAALLRHTDGPPFAHRHDRHPRRRR